MRFIRLTLVSDQGIKTVTFMRTDRIGAITKVPGAKGCELEIDGDRTLDVYETAEDIREALKNDK